MDRYLIQHRSILISFAARWPELLALIVVVESIGATLLAAHFHLAGEIPWIDYYVIWSIPGVAISVVIFCGWLFRLYRAGEARPVNAIVTTLGSFSYRTYLETLVPIIAMPAFLASCTTFKVLLQNFTTFRADPILARLDGIFGIQPWQVSHAVFGPMATVLIDRTYFSWFIVTHLMLLFVLFLPHLARHRAQVLFTFVGAWIVLGMVVALLVPSVGPCYYAEFFPINPYADLMARLNAINQTHHLTALGVQSRLWADHARDSVGIGSGISAMPSMHVSLATVTALLLRRMGYGWLGWLWLTLIWIGSFHLGWHYASDGIVAALVTMLIWKGWALFLSRSTGPAAKLQLEESGQVDAKELRI